MRKRHLTLVCRFLLAGVFLVGAFSMYSCSIENAAFQVLGKSSQPPQVLDCKAVSGDKINFWFSTPVRVNALQLSPPVESKTVEEEGSLIQIGYSGGPAAGNVLIADLLAEDERGNTVNVLAKMRTKNDRMPQLLINELRTEYSKPRTEFIEFKILQAGNLGAMRVYIAGTSRLSLVYEFEPVEVSAGELVVLHLRTLEDIVVDEYGSNLAESEGTDSSPTARDFWVPGSTKFLNKTGAVYVLDQDDNVLDAVMLSENPDTWWTKDHFVKAAELLFDKGAWQTADGKIAGPQDAVDTSGVKTAATRSISRDESVVDTNTAADWYVTATSGATPGKENSTKRQE